MSFRAGLLVSVSTCPRIDQLRFRLKASVLGPSQGQSTSKAHQAMTSDYRYHQPSVIGWERRGKDLAVVRRWYIGRPMTSDLAIHEKENILCNVSRVVSDPLDDS